MIDTIGNFDVYKLQSLEMVSMPHEHLTPEVPNPALLQIFHAIHLSLTPLFYRR